MDNKLQVGDTVQIMVNPKDRLAQLRGIYTDVLYGKIKESYDDGTFLVTVILPDKQIVDVKKYDTELHAI